jgi:protein-tyrosine phosphatase
MRPGVQKIAPDLWQSALAHLAFWPCLREHVDLIVLLAARVEELPSGVEVIDYPIDDNADGSPVFNGVRALAKALKNQRVCTVCHVGENRSGLLSALILVERGVKPSNAVRMVQERGPYNSPTQPHSFWNPGFVGQVLELEHVTQ